MDKPVNIIPREELQRILDKNDLRYEKLVETLDKIEDHLTKTDDRLDRMEERLTIHYEKESKDFQEIVNWARGGAYAIKIIGMFLAIIAGAGSAWAWVTGHFNITMK